jgi:hypothetical protein
MVGEQLEIPASLKFQQTLCDALLFKGLSAAVIQVST